MGHGNRRVLHFFGLCRPGIIIAVEPPPTATSLYRPLFFVQEDSPYIGSCLNLSTTATATKASVYPTAKKSSLQRPVFSATDGKVKNGYEISSVWRVDDLSQQSYILKVLHLYRCSKYNLSTWLMLQTLPALAR